MEKFNIADLFENAKLRIIEELQRVEEERRKNEEEEQLKAKEKIKHTEEVAAALVRLVYGILKTTKTLTGSIEKVPKLLGKISDDHYPSSYFIDDYGLRVELNYSNGFYDKSSFGNGSNFLGSFHSNETCTNDKINYEYLEQILNAYGIDINRFFYDTHQDMDVHHDIVVLKLKNMQKDVQLPPQRGNNK